MERVVGRSSDDDCRTDLSPPPEENIPLPKWEEDLLFASLSLLLPVQPSDVTVTAAAAAGVMPAA